MCGIAGWLGWVPNGDQIAGRLMDRLRHRGPDGQSVRQWPGAALVHTRLSIIDVSDNGAQPLSSEDQRVWTVFNGEIYNHRDLRSRLEVEGHVFRGTSDTEVLVHGYEQLGASGLCRRLGGMFAFALYDRRRRKLFLARDGFGIKPLYLRRSGRQLRGSLNGRRLMP